MIKDTTVAVATEDTRKTRMFIGGVRENFKITHLVYKIEPKEAPPINNRNNCISWVNTVSEQNKKLFGNSRDMIVMIGEVDVEDDIRNSEDSVRSDKEVSYVTKNQNDIIEDSSSDDNEWMRLLD